MFYSFASNWPQKLAPATGTRKLVGVYGSLVSLFALTIDLLTSKSNEFIFVSSCTEVVNLVKFPHAVCKISCQQTFSIWSWMGACIQGCMDSSNTACLQHCSNGGRRVKSWCNQSFVVLLKFLPIWAYCWCNWLSYNMHEIRIAVLTGCQLHAEYTAE